MVLDFKSKAMIITEIMFSGFAVRQFEFKFNSTHKTNIYSSIQTQDGTTFVTIDFGETSKELIFRFAFELGKIQKRLAKEGELMLPIDQYPLPPE